MAKKKSCLKVVRKRADVLVVKAGLAEDADQAARLILAGLVYYRHRGSPVRVEKPGDNLPEDLELEKKSRQGFSEGKSSRSARFVSRGGDKLSSALEFFALNLAEKICMDIGASTGGFSDCLLQAGAQRVYALDVGRGLLHEKLRNDSRIISIEGLNFRLIQELNQMELIPEKIDLATVDVSFISLRLILPEIKDFLRANGQILALVKPQFELPAKMTRKGLTKDEDGLQAALNMADFVRTHLDMTASEPLAAGIRGAKGNQEYFLLLENSER